MWPKKLPLRVRETTIYDMPLVMILQPGRAEYDSYQATVEKRWKCDGLIDLFLQKNRQRWEHINRERISMWPKKLPMRVRETTINGMLLVLVLRPKLSEYDSCKKNV